MKQIPLLQGKALLVELPEGAINPHIHPNSNGLWYKYEGDKGGFSYKRCDLPPGNWRIIGLLGEVTEEQVIPIVERESKPEYSYEQEYPEYVGDEWWYRDYQAQDDGDYKYSHYTAIESLESAILAEGFTFQNNLRNPDDVCYFSRDRMIADVREYHEVQSRVLDRSRCLLLGGGI